MMLRTMRLMTFFFWGLFEKDLPMMGHATRNEPSNAPQWISDAIQISNVEFPSSQTRRELDASG